ncbi:hypothetical protein A3C87_00030 [Candidatus Kaiserbacteria bacterium RIFCSPHIGHO2_02_FULL_49_34]|uniref:DUF2914 domain-containing protein n=1 Tax=Candidatus Kaiserbacteria bacterium RIFCSPHIGHO2_02_FULL_49_34 TaxID=1798491 RepID=A0A1F6DIY7_9BACT|nr:MAG: hypothetical protein A3C87_00030 [Candidatus Kaiserbacteria bacterium RIFCSPHIGHO2_02_FULL_49_34]
MEKIRAFIAWGKKNQHHLLSASFFVGFLIDSLTLNRVDDALDNIILASYMSIMMISTLVLYAALATKLPDRIVPFCRDYMPYLMQFAFGGVLSGMLIFYSRSGSWEASWPFLVIIIGVIAGNELLSRRAERLVFNLSVLFIALFSYTALIIPVLIGRMGEVVFVISSIIALGVFIVFVQALIAIVPNFIRLHLRSIVFAVAGIFATMQFLYFANLIPPIPLSLKDIGIYHKVERTQEGNYLLTYERQAWWRFWSRPDKTFTSSGGSVPHCYSSVFAPTKLATAIVHEWQQYDEASGEWLSRNTVSFGIAGGRAEGYRGYSYKESYTQGKWRCLVRTERGQTIGYTTFHIGEKSIISLDLETVIK